MNLTDRATFTQAVQLAQAGQKAQAYNIFYSLTAGNVNDADLLLWMVFTAPNLAASEQILGQLSRVAPANPNVQAAQNWLAQQKAKQAIPPPPFQPQPQRQSPVVQPESSFSPVKPDAQSLKAQLSTGPHINIGKKSIPAWVAVAVGLFVIITVPVIIGFISQTITNNQIKEAAISATATAAAAPTPTPGPRDNIGVSKAILQTVFAKKGFTFEGADAVKGQPRSLGKSASRLATLDLIGLPENLSSATMAVRPSPDNNPKYNEENTSFLLELLNQTMPEITDGNRWISENYQKIITVGEIREEHNGKRVRFWVSKQDGYIALSVSGMLISAPAPITPVDQNT